MHASPQPSVEDGPSNRLDATSRARRERHDRELLARYHRTRDRRDRDAIVERFMPLARRLAGRYNRRADSLDDLTQVASLALVKAVDRFDPTRGIAFSSYAVPTIVGEIKRHFRDHGWAVRPPRALAERALRVEAAARAVRRRASARADRGGAVRADRADRGGGARRAARRAGGECELARRARLQAGRRGSSLGERLGVDEVGYGIVEQRVLFEGLLRGVSPRDREILHMRYFEDMTQAEIGAAFGVSQMQVSRLVRNSIERMQLVAEAQPGGTSSTTAWRCDAGSHPLTAPPRRSAEIVGWRALHDGGGGHLGPARRPLRRTGALGNGGDRRRAADRRAARERAPRRPRDGQRAPAQAPRRASRRPP